MTASPEPDRTLPPDPEPLERFCERVRCFNPFTDNRVNGPGPTDVDVGSLHARAFEQLLGLAHEGITTQRGLGAVLWGEAGIGKSHLLARLAHWAEADRQGCLVYLHNLQASPANLPRSLLRAVVGILTRGRVAGFAQTPLYRMVNAAVREALNADRERTYSWEAAEEAFGHLVDRLTELDPSRAAIIDRTVYDVFFQFYRSAYLAQRGEDEECVAALALRWLSGDGLDPDEAGQLGLSSLSGQPVGLADAQQIKQVLVALSRLALSWRRPLILCFDQVDNLDADQAAALARFLQALIDSALNLLVVIAGVQATLMQWRSQKTIQDSAWDRLAQFEIALHRISATDGQQIVAARLRQFLQPFASLEPIAQQLHDDALFPLGQAWAAEFLQTKPEVRPRDVLNWAREGWRREQEVLQKLGGPAWLLGWRNRRPAPPVLPPPEKMDEVIDHKVSQKIDEHISRRTAEPHSLMPDAENLTGLVFALLKQCQTVLSAGALQVERLSATQPNVRPVCDLLIQQRPNGEGRKVQTGLLFLATESAYATTAALRRIVRAKSPRRILLVTDERQPLRLAARGKEYYEVLQGRSRQRFRHLELTVSQYADLDALVAVAGLARSGDLEVELPGGQVRPVTETEVIASYQRRERYTRAPVLEELVACGTEGITMTPA
jgi:hypothetical protein